MSEPQASTLLGSEFRDNPTDAQYASSGSSPLQGWETLESNTPLHRDEAPATTDDEGSDDLVF
jgi:hypothetical protein